MENKGNSESTTTTTTTTSTAPSTESIGVAKDGCNSSRILNINVGIMGHVDSGKTSLAKVLSTSLSTAALDKSPASQERGITLDLGFSSFNVDVASHPLLSQRSEIANHYDRVQFTLVDCPGHASLIRTIIGGSQIIDMMFLVIDINKGIQTQTAEIDQIPQESRQSKIDTMSTKLRKVLEKTCFSQSPMVSVSANPGVVSEEANVNNNQQQQQQQPLQPSQPIGLNQMIDELCKFIEIPKRDDQGTFLFEFDHCFQIKGQGSVLTGTVLKGSIEINQTVQIPQLNLEKKIKSMQMFHKPVKKVVQGDRAGICVTQLDSKLLERGLLCTPKTVPLLNGAIISIEKVRFYKNLVKTNSHFHVTIGHTTTTAIVTFFGNKILDQSTPTTKEETGSIHQFNEKIEYSFMEYLEPTSLEYPVGSQFALIKFDHPVLCPLESVIIGSKLDVALDTSGCRIAFHGSLLQGIDASNRQILHDTLRIFKTKVKEGAVERVHSEDTLIGKNLFSKQTDLSSFIGNYLFGILLVSLSPLDYYLNLLLKRVDKKTFL
ncbi:Selenocysteine-specific elongation factor [Cavenderia fasciculata]|uniref:Selenocysteine-specific elongation factor n=1 Tax=Cavenderia fasciculata TaxID=261658 RepID=F4Q0X9_CACFS|nr:Selenocysteine-specific elongation factor [Cavenderia fasciculata]EGG18480.1 Selenocysteine-specific elongation factor [Cavenderia fasciculata]|eukprot:XP_004366384.1 Selenocysteine-specific elongation factor [Cavenderia fasciculata]